MSFPGPPPQPSRAPPSSPDSKLSASMMPPAYTNGVVGPAPPEKDIVSKLPSSQQNIVRRKLTGYVGFANLPNQWHRKSVRKGFHFNVMVVGTTPRTALGGLRTCLTLFLLQASQGWASRRWLTRCSTQVCMPLGTALALRPLRSRRRSTSVPSLPTSRRTACD